MEIPNITHRTELRFGRKIYIYTWNNAPKIVHEVIGHKPRLQSTSRLDWKRLHTWVKDVIENAETFAQ